MDGRQDRIAIERAYDRPPPGGDAPRARVLVDRMWPRGLTKEAAGVDLWLKEAAPSAELRRWFDHDAARWRDFQARYAAELDGRPDVVGELLRLVDAGGVTLVYAARDRTHNNAAALKAYLERRLATEGPPR